MSVHRQKPNWERFYREGKKDSTHIYGWAATKQKLYDFAKAVDPRDRCVYTINTSYVRKNEVSPLYFDIEW